MSENLSEMVKSGPTEETIVFSEDDLDIPSQVETPVEQQDQQINSINIIPLVNWFDGNVDTFPNIKKPTVSIQGVDPSEQLIMTVLTSVDSGDEKRKLIVYDDAHLQPVLDLPALDMRIYNNGFRIIYNFGNGIFIKSYGVRTGLISVFCNDIEDKLIPYGVIRAKKRENSINVIQRSPAEVIDKLNETLDYEALQLRYRQSVKAEGLTTNGEAIDWLLARQGSIEDINHHLQIDNVIIDTLA